MSWNSGGPGENPNPWGSAGGPGQGGQRPPGGNGPWGGGNGQRPGGPGPGRPGGQGPIPDLDLLIARLQAAVRRVMGGGRGSGPGAPRMGSGRGILLIGLGALALWLASGLYRVQPDELGVVLRFGAYSYRTQPGLNWHLPWPIESVEKPAVTRINRTEIGYRSGSRGQGNREVQAEGLMLTGDENIIDINLAVFWKISNAVDYLFNVRDPEGLVKAVAESSLREEIGRTPIQPALTEARAQIETDVLRQTQQIMNRYKAGIEITQVQLQKVDPPNAVIESFRDVQRANTDAERLRNEAEAYRNDVVPRARGQAAQIVAEAQGARQAAVAQATGESQRFDSVLKAYEAAKDVTLKRMYIDTMRDIMSHAHTLVVDDRLKGLVPFLPLNLPQPAPAPRTAPPRTGTPSQAAPQPSGNGQ
jgi:membrane protease subunit HflK